MLFIWCTTVSYIYNPDSSPSLSYIWSWIFPFTVLYMILIFPRHCLIYDPDSSPSLSYIWSWFFPVTLTYDPESSPSLSYIWSWFFPVTVLYTGMILNLPRHCLIYDPDSSPSCTVLYMILILPRQYLIVHENRRYTFGKVRVGRNKWYLYFMLFTYGLFRLTRKSIYMYTVYIYIYMIELYSLVKSSRKKKYSPAVYLFISTLTSVYNST